MSFCSCKGCGEIKDTEFLKRTENGIFCPTCRIFIALALSEDPGPVLASAKPLKKKAKTKKKGKKTK